MNLSEAQTMTINLMNDHGLSHWNFDWHNKKRAFGTCNSTKQTIFLSMILVPMMNKNAVMNTVLHEIAHALVGTYHKHNHVWRRKALEIGCDGNRTNNYDSVDTTKLAKYKAVCVHGKLFTFHRKKTRDCSCNCEGGSYNEKFKLNLIQQY